MKKMIGLVMMMGLVVSFVDRADDDSVPTASSVAQDMYAETIVGTWEISGSTLTITDSFGDFYDEYPIEIESMSNNRLVYIQTFDKVDGSGTIEGKITMTR